MYRFPGNAATGVTGTAQPSENWYFAAGFPTFHNMPVDKWLLLQNPNEFPVFATITLFDTEGQRKSFSQTLPATSRQSIFLNQQFASPSFGIQVEATGGIVAERSVFMGTTGSLGNRPQGAYATQGAPRLATAWVLPEGSTAPPFSETVSVLNPHSSTMTARFEFMLEDGRTVTQEFQIQPGRVFDLELDGHVVPAGGVSTRVTTSLPSVVERTMFWSARWKHRGAQHRRHSTGLIYTSTLRERHNTVSGVGCGMDKFMVEWRSIACPATPLLFGWRALPHRLYAI